MDLPAGRVDEKVLSWVRASRENYSHPNISKLYEKQKEQIERVIAARQAITPRRSVLRAGQCRFRNFCFLFFVRTEEPEANFLNAIEDAIVSEARDPGSNQVASAQKN